MWYFLSQLCTYTPGKYLVFNISNLCVKKKKLNRFSDNLGLVFYKCGDDVEIKNHDRISNFEKNLILNETLTFNSNIESVNNRTQMILENEDITER